MLPQLFLILTFPGVMFHELGHKWTCNLLGVKVKDYKLFTLNMPGQIGYVAYKKPKKYFHSFLINVAPLISSSIISMFFFYLTYKTIDEYYLSLLMKWLAVSTAVHALPSKSDADNIWDETMKEIKYNIFVGLAFPVIGILYLLNLFNNIFFIGSMMFTVAISKLTFFILFNVS